ncbi:S28 family serine protease [Streptomyces varsoviensis]|nr:S28 family serine protease [Streptomyces varsoviensis]
MPVLLAGAGAGGVAAGAPSAAAAQRATASAGEANRAADEAHRDADEGIRDRLAGIPGMRVLAEVPAAAGYRYFRLSYRQPIDHRHPEQGTFDQRLTLLHKSVQRPMVLYTTGYELGDDPAFRSEPTQLVDGNQISTEQRYFGTSRPRALDWSKLDIWQAASDHHRLVRALKSVYRAPWISTGGSKGGMAAVYHRRFYPDDVAGTVAYSATNNTDDRDDSAWDAFLGRVGPASCRAALSGAQRAALERRTELVARYARWAREEGRGFDIIGSADKAYELAVLRLPMMFWMYQGSAGCESVPRPDASDDALYGWLEKVTQLPVYTDRTVASLTPYFYQLGTELGYPHFAAPHLKGLLRYPGVQEMRTYVPRDIPLRFRPAAMPDIDRWVRQRGSRMLFVYGAEDPGRSEPFRVGEGGGAGRDAHVYVAPGGAHRARIAMLDPADAGQATAAVRSWARGGK